MRETKSVYERVRRLRKKRGTFFALGLAACLCLAAGCSDENTPAPPETTLESEQPSETEQATEILVAETEKFSRISVPVEEPTEPYFHMNGDRLSAFEQPDRVTVIPAFREEMGYTPLQVTPELADKLVGYINDLELEGYDREQSQFELPAGGGNYIRLYYGEEMVEFHETTQYIIRFKGAGDTEYRYFISRNADAYRALADEMINIQAGMDFE